MNGNFNQLMGMPQRNQFMPYFNSSPSAGANASTNNIVWVQGIEGAKAWQLSPNSMVILLDSEAEGKMYIKVSDNIGMSTLRIFNYVEEITANATSNVTENKSLDLSEYVKKDELENMIRNIVNEHTISTVAPAGSTAVPATNATQSKVVTIKK